MRKLGLLCMIPILAGCLKTRSELNEQEEQKVYQNQISEIRQEKLTQEMRNETLENELRHLKGKVEVLERSLQEKNSQNTSEEAVLQKQVKDLIEQMKVFETNQTQTLVRLEKLEKNQKSDSDEPKSAPGEKKKNSWDRAEDLFLKKDWKNAALAYQTYTEQNPKGQNMSMALYKIGVCFQELKLKDEAKTFFEETISKHPNSPAAKKAKYRLNQMK